MTGSGRPEKARPGNVDVLEMGAPGRAGIWVTLVAVAVLALLGWQLRPGPAAPAPSSPLALAAPTPAPEPLGSPAAQWTVDEVADVSFVNDTTAFAVLRQCSAAVTDAFGCARRLLATTDGGTTWNGLRPLPAMAQGHDHLLALSAEELMLLDLDTLADVVRSTDGGRSWVRLPVDRAGPLPVTPSGVLVLGGPVVCTVQCAPTTVGWFDPATLRVHPLPAQPSAEELSRSQTTAVTTVGADIVVGGTTLTGAYVAVSRDRGRTWSQDRLDPALDPGFAVTRAQVRAAGDGRVYAFVQAHDRAQGSATYGYRSDDGGVGWQRLPLVRWAFDWPPPAVVGGELLVTDESGRVFGSSAGGTSWTEVASPGGLWITQAAPGEVVVGTAWRSADLQEHFLSRDGRTWVPMVLPD